VLLALLPLALLLACPPQALLLACPPQTLLLAWTPQALLLASRLPLLSHLSHLLNRHNPETAPCQ